MTIVIVITGNPGTGKTTIAQKLNSHGFMTLNLFDLAKSNGCVENYDVDREAYVVDENCIEEYFIENFNEDYQEEIIVIESHYGHLIPQEYVDHCFVLSVTTQILKKRYEKRGYSEEKINENLQAQIFEECYYDALETFGQEKVTKIENQGISSTVNTIKNQIDLLQG